MHETRLALLKSPRAQALLTVRLRHKDGSWRHFEGNAQNLLDVPGAEGITLNARDVTARVEASERLAQSQKMEAVGRLAAGVAHDFNNILTAIQGHGELLLGSIDGNDEGCRVDVEEILRAAERATALTRQLLAFSRRQVMRPRPIDVTEVINGLRRMLERLIGEHIVLDISSDANLAVVKADPGQLEQVLLNLVVNARDAMPQGGRIVIRARNVYAAHERTLWNDIPQGCYVALDVADTGTGIHPVTLPHIFEPFFTTKTPDQGTGLGLATVYGIVQQSGGYLKVETELGRGTTFTVLLPVVGEPPQHSAVRAVAERQPGKEVILVVEDEASVRALVSRVLIRDGYTVLQAESGAAALIAAQTAPQIDVLLTDVVMPIMNGCTLASALLVGHPRCKVLYMSGHNDEMVARYGVAEGSHYLQKPFKASELSTILRKVIEN